MPVTSVVARLPWKQIIAYLPEVARAAKTVWSHWDGRQNPEIDPTASVEQQLNVIAKRIQSLEANEKEQAAVVSQIADQLEGLALGLKETAAQQTIVLRVAIVALLLSIGALAAVFVT